MFRRYSNVIVDELKKQTLYIMIIYTIYITIIRRIAMELIICIVVLMYFIRYKKLLYTNKIFHDIKCQFFFLNGINPNSDNPY